MKVDSYGVVETKNKIGVNGTNLDTNDTNFGTNSEDNLNNIYIQYMVLT